MAKAIQRNHEMLLNGDFLRVLPHGFRLLEVVPHTIVESGCGRQFVVLAAPDETLHLAPVIRQWREAVKSDCHYATIDKG